MKITLTKLNELEACNSGVEWFKAQKESELTPLCYALIDASHANWAHWLVTRLMNHSQRVAYAFFAAEQVIDIFERRYPDDKRPRLAIDAAKNYLVDPSTKNKAATAADAAYDAAVRADAAADAAARAAADAAYAAAYAADAAYAAAAADAAADAAYAAARKELQIKIISYGLRFIKQFNY